MAANRLKALCNSLGGCTLTILALFLATGCAVYDDDGHYDDVIVDEDVFHEDSGDVYEDDEIVVESYEEETIVEYDVYE